jgi:hypothetical protein
MSEHPSLLRNEIYYGVGSLELLEGHFSGQVTWLPPYYRGTSTAKGSLNRRVETQQTNIISRPQKPDLLIVTHISKNTMA